MKAVRELARFRSRRFVPILPEACQLAPKTYGAELAFWLAGKLALQGIATGYPAPGERCWLLRWEPQAGAVFEVVCVNCEGSKEHWRVALVRDDGAGGASFDAAQPLVNAIRFVLHAAVPRGEIAWCDQAGPGARR